MLTVHNYLRTWHQQVDMFIALSAFARQKFVEGGLPSEKVTVKPNFMLDPDVEKNGGDYFLFVGRLSPEKGISTLLESWEHLCDIPLMIAGDGSLLPSAQTAATMQESKKVISVLGRVPHEQILTLMRGARCLVFPSGWYEGFPMTIVEAFACGLPVIVSKLGSMPEIVTDGVTGLHVAPGDPEDLAVKVRWAWSHPHEMRQMGLAARREYEEKYTAEKNYQMLIDIYERAIQENRLR
jgi:glycosyltransferase involved in cell wall biosynthesis